MAEPMPVPPEASDLKRKTATSVLWTMVRSTLDQVFAFVVFVVLARLLSQEDIGVYAIAYVIAEVGRIIATNGVIQLVAKAKAVEQRFLSTVFWTNVAAAAIFGVLIVAGATLAAAAFDIPQLGAVLPAMAVPVVVNSLGATHMALRLREFGHKTIALRSLLSGLIGGSAALAAAFAGFGIWSLVIQRVVNETISAVLSIASYRWKPTLEFDGGIFRRNIAFGSDLTAAQLIFLFLVRIQDFIIGAVLGPALVGVYRVAWRTVEIFAAGSIQPFSTVALQTFSRLSHDTAALRQAYRTMIRVCSALSFPAIVGLGVLSPELVHVVYGEKWDEAGRLGQVFAFMAVPFTLNYFSSPVLSALGEGRKQRYLALTQLALTVILTLAAVRYGLLWVAVCYVARAYITMPLQMRFLSQAAGITPNDTWRAVKCTLAASLLMGGALLLFKVLYAGPALLVLGIGIPASVAIYTVLLALICPSIVGQVRQVLTREKNGKSKE